jgi:DNA invertase Pin-like site-specific DNA recombinase
MAICLDLLSQAMAGLNTGDVAKLIRLGRSTRELLDLIDRIAKAGASFRSLGDPLWDTASAQGRLLSTRKLSDYQRAGAGRRRKRSPESGKLRRAAARRPFRLLGPGLRKRAP